MIWTNASVTLDLPDNPTPEDVRKVLNNPEIVSAAIVDGVISVLTRNMHYTEFRPCTTEP